MIDKETWTDKKIRQNNQDKEIRQDNQDTYESYR